MRGSRLPGKSLSARLGLFVCAYLWWTHALQAQSSDPCLVETTRGRSLLGLSLDSLRVQALRPAGPCGAVAEGWYRGRYLLAFGLADGRLTDTLALQSDSAWHWVVPWPEGVLRLRSSPLEEGLNLERYAKGPGGLTLAGTERLVLAGVPGLDILPPPPLDMDTGTAHRYATRRFDLLSVGAAQGHLLLLNRRRQLACAPGRCCQPERWKHFLVELPPDALGQPSASKARVRALPPAYCAQAPLPACAGQPGRPASCYDIEPRRQPIVRALGGWVLTAGHGLVLATDGGFAVLSHPAKSDLNQVFLEGERPGLTDGAPALQPAQAYWRTGGWLRQASERHAFRLQERWVVTGVHTAALPPAGGAWPKNLPPLPVPDGVEESAIPLAFLGGVWWLRGYGRIKETGKVRPGFGQ